MLRILILTLLVAVVAGSNTSQETRFEKYAQTINFLENRQYHLYCKNICSDGGIKERDKGNCLTSCVIGISLWEKTISAPPPSNSGAGILVVALIVVVTVIGLIWLGYQTLWRKRAWYR